MLDQLLSLTHITAASLSLILGAFALINTKGTHKHIKKGLWYFYAMLINNISSLFILKAFGNWFFPHYLAITCLVVLIPGVIAIKLRHKHWLKVHIISMVLSYYLLIGGAINELFLHVSQWRPLIINNDPAVGYTHMFVQLFFIGLIIYFLKKYKNRG